MTENIILPREKELSLDQVEQIGAVLKEKRKRVSFVNLNKFIPPVSYNTKMKKKKPVLDSPIKRTATQLSQHTNHFIYEDRSLNARKKSLSSLDKKQKQKVKKSIPKTFKKNHFQQFYETEEEEYLFIRPIDKVLLKKEKKGKPLKKSKKMGIISSQSDYSQIIEGDDKQQNMELFLRKKQKNFNRSHSSFQSTSQVKKPQRPKSSYKPSKSFHKKKSTKIPTQPTGEEKLRSSIKLPSKKSISPKKDLSKEFLANQNNLLSESIQIPFQSDELANQEKKLPQKYRKLPSEERKFPSDFRKTSSSKGMLSSKRNPSQMKKSQNPPSSLKKSMVSSKRIPSPQQQIPHELELEFEQKLEKQKKMKNPIFPPIKYPDIKVNPFRIPTIPQPPKPNMSLSQYIQLSKELCRKFKIQLREYEDFYIKKFKNCIMFEPPNSKKTVVWHYSGKLYVGGWQNGQLGEGKKIHEGFQLDENGNCYKGQFKNGKRSGFGTFLQNNGNVYQGFWKHGVKEGRGIFYEKEFGRYYYGQWKNGRKNGYGIHQFSKKHFYQGDFVISVPEGIGIEVFENGDIYRGQFRNGRYYGEGKYEWPNGSYYKGQFANGQRSGVGFWRSKKTGGDLYYGQFRHNKKNGFGIYEEKNGNIYRGTFNMDLRDGAGKIQYKSGNSVKGIWVNNNLVQIRKRMVEVMEESDSESNRNFEKLLRSHFRKSYTKINQYK